MMDVDAHSSSLMRFVTKQCCVVVKGMGGAGGAHVVQEADQVQWMQCRRGGLGCVASEYHKRMAQGHARLMKCRRGRLLLVSVGGELAG